MSVFDVLAQRDEQYKRDLQKIGSAIGYGNAQHLLGQLWDEMLYAEYGASPGWGAMGVTCHNSRLVTLDQAVRAVVEKHGGVRAAERATGVDKSFISRLMNGKKVAPSAETLQALGLRAVPLFEVMKTPNVGGEAHAPRTTL